jgi:hypothetical protein
MSSISSNSPIKNSGIKRTLEDSGIKRTLEDSGIKRTLEDSGIKRTLEDSGTQEYPKLKKRTFKGREVSQKSGEGKLKKTDHKTQEVLSIAPSNKSKVNLSDKQMKIIETGSHNEFPEIAKARQSANETISPIPVASTDSPIPKDRPTPMDIVSEDIPAPMAIIPMVSNAAAPMAIIPMVPNAAAPMAIIPMVSNAAAPMAIIPMVPNAAAPMAIIPMVPNAAAPMAIIPMVPNAAAPMAIMPMVSNAAAPMAIMPIARKSSEDQGGIAKLVHPAKYHVDNPKSKASSSKDASASKQGLKKEENVDEYKLLKGSDGQIKDTNYAYYMNQAALLSNEEGVAKEMIPRLRLAALHAYSKAATISESDSKELGIQTSPFMAKDMRYYRTSHNQLLDGVSRDYANAMQKDAEEIILIDNPQVLCEEFARKMPGQHRSVDSEKTFSDLVDEIFQAVQSSTSPKGELIIDFTNLLKGKCSSSEVDKTVQNFVDILKKKIDAAPYTDVQKQNFKKEILNKLHFIAFLKYKKQNILFLPKLAQKFAENLAEANRYESNEKTFKAKIHEILAESGCLVTPDQAKQAWLKVTDIGDTPEFKKITLAAEFSPDKAIPTVCGSYKEFIEGPVMKFMNAFQTLSLDPNTPPYLKIEPKAAADLLKGLAQDGIDAFLKEKGLNNQLQLFYFFMKEAMHEAYFRKDDQAAFNNAMEAIHQGIQNMLAILQPYDKDALANAVIANLKNLENSIIPEGITPKVYANASAMRCLSSVLGGVEKQKGSNKLEVVVLGDTYYESEGVVKNSLTYSTSSLSGDFFNQNKGEAIDYLHGPVDLFVCEFHHNISLNRTSYSVENVTDQVKELFIKKKAAEKLTVVIDSTIDLQQSDELRKFLADDRIKDLIQKGRLNVVILRSAQKFDMLGRDNYGCGLAITINDNKSFPLFDKRMGEKDDQLTDLSYQGLSHLQTHAGDHIENYRKGIMDNTQKLYNMLPKEIIHSRGDQLARTPSPMQISEITDKRLVFLDVKFPGHPFLNEAFFHRWSSSAQENQLFSTARSSFGFDNTNVTLIHADTGSKMRVNPGLEGEKKLEEYAKFIRSIHTALVNEISKKPKNCTEEEDTAFEKHLAECIKNCPLV